MTQKRIPQAQQVRVDFDILERLYVYMLQGEEHKLRWQNQDLLCYMRDTLADMRGWTSQESQEYYETRAVQEKHGR